MGDAQLMPDVQILFDGGTGSTHHPVDGLGAGSLAVKTDNLS